MIIKSIGTDGYFPILKKSRKNNMLSLCNDFHKIVEQIDEAEENLNLANVRTMISTFVYLQQPEDGLLISEKLLDASE